MNLKSARTSALYLLITTSILMSCSNDNYSKIPEVLNIQNNTRDEFYVKYGFTDSVPNAYHKNIQLIGSMGQQSNYEFEYSMITDLWMSESKFNELVSQISIYKIQHNDTSYVNPKYFNKKSAWEHKVYNVYNSGLVHIFNDSITTSYNQLIVCDSMFTK